MYKSICLQEGLWEITDYTDESSLSVDMYLIEGSERALLVDAGNSKEDLKGFLSSLTNKPIDLIITHGHGDHAAAFSQFERIHIPHIDIPILNDCFGFNMNSNMVLDVTDGQIFSLGDSDIEVIALPGHTPGSIVLLDAARQLLFTSDSLGSGSLWMQLPGCSSVEAYVREIDKLEKRVEQMEQLKLFVGHDCQRSLNYGKQYISDVKHAAQGIVSGELIGVPTEDQNEIFGGLTVAYGQMEYFIYKQDNIRDSGKDK